jgi:CheY-like chemotaxis protein
MRRFTTVVVVQLQRSAQAVATGARSPPPFGADRIDDMSIKASWPCARRGNPAIEISMADAGQVALRQIATGQFWPDAILLDLMMPGLDGDEFLAALDAINHTREIAVIVMTAVPPAAVPQAVRRRARSILFKPFAVDQVAAALRAVLKN